MFERLKRLYEENRLTKDGLKKAVAESLITADQYEEITREKYNG